MRIALAASALAVTLTTAGLASCAGSGGPPLPPGPEPSGTPVYASDEEALAAAEAAYQRYLDVSDAVGAAGWGDVDSLREVERGEALDDELATASTYFEKGYRQVGKATFDSTTLQQYSAGSAGPVLITIYLCLDVSNVDLVDENGLSVINSARLDRQALEIDIDDVDGSLKMSRSEPWSGASFC